jgi:hypothetical protein
MGEVVIPKIRRRWSTWDLMRRMRPGRARLIADRGSQGTKAPDVDSSPFADKIYPSSSLTSRLLTLKAKSDESLNLRLLRTQTDNSEVA